MTDPVERRALTDTEIYEGELEAGTGRGRIASRGDGIAPYSAQR